MDPRTYNIRVDFTLPTIIPRIEFTKGDIGGSLISCSLFNNNKPVPVTGKTVTLTLKKPDEVDVVYDLPSPNLHDNVADFYPDLNGLNVPGTVLFTVEVYDGLTRVTSRRMQYVVTDSLNIEDDIASFKDYPVLTGLIAEVQPVKLAEADRVIAEDTREAQEDIRKQNEAARVQRMTELEGVSAVQFDSRLKQAETDLAKNASQTNINKSDISTLKSQITGAVNGSPIPVTLVSQMTDHARNYVYLGTESGYNAGNLYYWNGSAFVDSGKQYQSTGIGDGTITLPKLGSDVMPTIELKRHEGFVQDRVNEQLQDNAISELTGTKNGTQNFIEKANCTISYVDNTETQPLDVNKVPKILRVSFKTAADTYFAFAPISNINYSNTNNFIIGAWFRKSDLTGTQPQYACVNLYASFLNSTGGLVENVISGNVGFDKVNTIGYTISGSTSANGVIITGAVEHIIGDWVYITFKANKLPPNTASLKGYIRFLGVQYLTSTAGKFDIMNYTLVRNSTHLIPYKVYPESVLDNSTAKIINIQNSDKITICGDSYSQGVYNPKDKAYICNLSMLTDYRIENYAVSGNGYHEIIDRIRNNTPVYHPSLGIKDYGSTYALFISCTNDIHSKYVNLKNYFDLVSIAVETAKSLGMQPIISTEWLHENPQLFSGLRKIADEYGAVYIDVITNRYKFYSNDYAPFLGEGHPGVRVNALLYEPIKKAISTLPRPKQGIKIFRKRSGVVVSNINDLLCDTIPQRAKTFKEISVGHGCLVDGQVKYYDALDRVVPEQGAFQRNNIVYSEYLKLQNKESVTFNDYALVEVITPSTSNSMKDFTLHLSDPTITVYARNMFSGDYESNGDTFFTAFIVNENVNVSPGDTYTSNDADLGGQTFTVYAKYKDKILVTPALWSTWRTGAGTLTKVSGSGDTTIPYTDTTFGENPLFYDQVDKPKGKYSQVAGNINGDFIISGSDVKKFMNYDKFHFLLYKAGGFALTDIYGTYHGNDDKLYVQKQVPKEIKGTELLAQTNVGDSEISAWTITGSVTPYATSDTGLPYSTTKVVDVSVNNKISQTLTYTKDVADKKIQIKVWARVFPSVFNPTSDISTAPITSDSFDLGTLGIELANPGQLSQEFTDIVGLHWKEILIDTVAPAQSSTMTITVYSKDKTIQIAKVSVKIES